MSDEQKQKYRETRRLQYHNKNKNVQKLKEIVKKNIKKT